MAELVDRTIAAAAKAWPFEEARKVVARLGSGSKDGPVVFETGYGPSGLPHIGTFGEVARTTMVRRAFEALTGGEIPTQLIAFSDDMDGMRKIPGNLPNAEKLEPFIGRPLTEVPDPFGTHESFAHHNNARLRGCALQKRQQISPVHVPRRPCRRRAHLRKGPSGPSTVKPSAARHDVVLC